MKRGQTRGYSYDFKYLGAVNQMKIMTRKQQIQMGSSD